MSNMNNQRASTLIELLAAVSIIATVLTAISAMITMSVRLADSNEKKELALQKAEEALEFFRKERSINSWYGFTNPLDDEARYCISSLPGSVASLSAKLGVCADNDVLEAARYEFKREAVVTFDSNNSLSVEIDLLWNDSGKAKNLSLQQNFENY